MSTQTSARTYNQNHIPREYTPGKRRLSIYWSWSYPWESQRDPATLDNRFSTMTEVRTALWPHYETPEWSAAQFLQGIAGTLELFHRSTLSFQQLAGEVTGHPVAVFQRIDQAGFKLPIDERILADADTLMVFGLDHLLSEQEAAPEEVAAIREWLNREGACLVLAPHHDVGFTDDLKQRQMEYLHHGDPLVPRQQRFGQFQAVYFAFRDRRTNGRTARARTGTGSRPAHPGERMQNGPARIGRIRIRAMIEQHHG